MRAHIRVDLIYLLMPVRVQRVLDIVSMASFAGVMGIVVTHAWGTLAESLR